MSIYLPPSIQKYEPRKMVFSTWVDHLPFGYDIVAALRPSTVVELGTYNGLSFYSFCQSMIENDIDGLCYAVDTWEGDKHTDKYDDSIYKDVNQHCRENYRGISYLLRMLFNEALNNFSDESIDLLHIDGLHTYEAVTEDFTNWYPKVKPGGVILFHDIQAKIQDFGAWKFWEETSPKFESFTFKHGYGLGVLKKPGGEPLEHQLLKLLFESTEQEQHDLRKFYVHAGHFFETKRQVKRFKPKNIELAKGGQGK
jgi:hypothetical protein